MKAVVRYDLTLVPTGSPAIPIASVVVPVGSEITSVRMPWDDSLIMWFLVDLASLEGETRSFARYGDGDGIDGYKKFIGTFRTDANATDNHIFEV